MTSTVIKGPESGLSASSAHGFPPQVYLMVQGGCRGASHHVCINEQMQGTVPGAWVFPS